MPYNVDWKKTYAAVYRAKKGYLKPIVEIDAMALDSLVNIDIQKKELLNNTKRFLESKPANNALLWGGRGTGKSSLIKAVLLALKEEGLRLIEVDRDDLMDLPEIVDELRQSPYKFIIFCDDLSFERGESGYRGLKRILEGSIEAKPKNVLVYATSNRRHILPELHSDNEGTVVDKNGEIHFSDAVEEAISLSDRFGLWLSFYTGTQQEYLKIVESYFPNYTGDKKLLAQKAIAFATLKGSKSGRVAKQFFNSFSEESL